MRFAKLVDYRKQSTWYTANPCSTPNGCADTTKISRDANQLHHLTAENNVLPDATVFAYEYSIHVGPRAPALSLKRVGRSGKVGIDVKHPENESSENNDQRNLELSDFILERASIPEKE